MSREILFRAKAINRDPDREYRINYKNGDWVYGLVTTMYDDRFPNLPAKMKNTDGVSGIDVDHRTIGEYTGLTDKNGTKIFEGDIISKDFYTNHKQTKSKRFNGVVEYKVRCGKGFGADGEDFKSWAAEWSVKFDFWNYEQKYRSYSWGLFFDCEVIGNIYDNPELIEK